MNPPADYFRRRGFDAQQRSTRTSSEEIRNVFQEAAESWFELADVCDNLDRLEDRLEANQPADKHQ
jgi:prophage antirepressor-like protein